MEASIIEIKNLLLPCINHNDYKDKEKELQEFIKKYDAEIQIKKQKQCKRDVMDYKNMNVYKWQLALEDPNEELDDTLMDDSSGEASGENRVGILATTPQQVGPTNHGMWNREQPRPSNWSEDRPVRRRVSYQEPPGIQNTPYTEI